MLGLCRVAPSCRSCQGEASPHQHLQGQQVPATAASTAWGQQPWLLHTLVTGDKDGSGINIYPGTEWIQLSSFLLEDLLVIICICVITWGRIICHSNEFKWLLWHNKQEGRVGQDPLPSQRGQGQAQGHRCHRAAGTCRSDAVPWDMDLLLHLPREWV